MELDFNKFTDAQKEHFTKLLLEFIKNPHKLTFSQQFRRYIKVLKIMLKTFPFGIISFLFFRNKTDPFNKDTIILFDRMMHEHMKIAKETTDDWKRKVMECFTEMDKLTVEATYHFVKIKNLTDEAKTIKKEFLLIPNFEQAKRLFLIQTEILELSSLAFNKYVEKAKVQRELEQLYKENFDKKKDIELVLKTAYITVATSIAHENPAISALKFEMMTSFWKRSLTYGLLTEELTDTKDFEGLKKITLSRLDYITTEVLKTKN